MRGVPPDQKAARKAIAERFASAISGGSESQIRLAEQLGFGRSTLTGWKKGRTQPSLEVFAEVCRRLNVSADWLLGVSNASAVAESSPVYAASPMTPREALRAAISAALEDPQSRMEIVDSIVEAAMRSSLIDEAHLPPELRGAKRHAPGEAEPSMRAGAGLKEVAKAKRKGRV